MCTGCFCIFFSSSRAFCLYLLRVSGEGAERLRHGVGLLLLASLDRGRDLGQVLQCTRKTADSSGGVLFQLLAVEKSEGYSSTYRPATNRRVTGFDSHYCSSTAVVVFFAFVCFRSRVKLRAHAYTSCQPTRAQSKSPKHKISKVGTKRLARRPVA